MPLRILLLRHGRSLANEQGLIASTVETAGEAFGLTQAGRQEVHKSVEMAGESGGLEPPVLLISSPLLRARESAEVAAAILGVPVTIDSRLLERDFGQFERESDDHYERVWAADRLDAAHRSWGVESVVDVLSRAGAVVIELTGEERTGTAILCTHGDVASTLLCASLDVPLERHREVGALYTGALHPLGVRIG